MLGAVVPPVAVVAVLLVGPVRPPVVVVAVPAQAARITEIAARARTLSMAVRFISIPLDRSGCPFWIPIPAGSETGPAARFAGGKGGVDAEQGKENYGP
jgi:hypothetical protein